MPVEIRYLECWPGTDREIGESTFIENLEEGYTEQDVEALVFRRVGHHDFKVVATKEIHHKVYPVNQKF